MVSHSKALHIALKTYPSVLETAFLAASTNQRDWKTLSEDPWPVPPTQEMQSLVVSQAVTCSIITQHIRPMKRGLTLQFSPGGVNKQILLLSWPLKRITHETQNQRVAEVGREPRRSHRVLYSRLPKTRLRLTFFLTRLFPNS